jgi:hypothetical protein
VTQLAQVGDLLSEHLDIGHSHPPTRRAGSALRRGHRQGEQGRLGERRCAEYRAQ